MAKEVYEQLRQLLDRYPMGCPPSPYITEILETLFTEDEAKVALGLGFRPFSVEDIARRANLDPGVAKVHLESLADKGVVFAREKNGDWGYALLPTIPGIFEYPYMKGVHDETIEKLSPLWKKYHSMLIEYGEGKSPSFFRSVPIQEEVENKPGVLTYEKVYEMIDKAKTVGIAHCACRELEEKCDAPREACMLFDENCDYLVERGFARYLTKEEMKEKLRELDEAGLVHNVNNFQDKLTVICNCCPCCCFALRSYQAYKDHHGLAMTSSGFIPVNDPELCTGCGICADDRCPMEAIEIVDEVAVVDIDKCIGCGLCVTGCPNQALSLERKEDYAEPPETVGEMGMQLLAESGKLEDFMECMNP